MPATFFFNYKENKLFSLYATKINLVLVMIYFENEGKEEEGEIFLIRKSNSEYAADGDRR